jgi:hypothetical protein
VTRARALVLLAILGLAATTATATHEVYYRYVVLGYVKDARGHAVRGRELELIRDKTGAAYLGASDEQGFFVIVARLGDESAGEALTLKAGGTATRLRASFDPANHRDDRGTRIDIEGANFVERSALFRSTLLDAVGTTQR